MQFLESHTQQLDDLLSRICHNLELNQTRRQNAEDRYKSISKWLADEKSILFKYNPRIYTQGSFRIGTTVKPIHQNEYDLDLVCEMEIDWRKHNPTAVLNFVEFRLKESDIYAPILERKNRCIRINYADEFHLDILPAAPDGFFNEGRVKVPDRKAVEWKDSNPKGYAGWFEERANLVVVEEIFKAIEIEPLPDPEAPLQKPPLKRIVQLIKRQRDVAFQDDMDNAPISIVLTTLAGKYYNGQNSVNEGLEHILNQIIRALPSDGSRLIVLNPTNPKEDLSEKWDQNPEAYRKFVVWIKDFHNSWLELLKKSGIHEITELLTHLFGESAKTAIKQQTDYLGKAANAGQLRQYYSTGLLTGTVATQTTPIRRHNFYGK